MTGNGYKRVEKSSDSNLGPSGRRFEPCPRTKNSDAAKQFLRRLEQPVSLMIAAQSLRRSGLLLHLLANGKARHYTETQEICMVKVFIPLTAFMAYRVEFKRSPKSLPRFVRVKAQPICWDSAQTERC